MCFLLELGWEDFFRAVEDEDEGLDLELFFVAGVSRARGDCEGEMVGGDLDRDRDRESDGARSAEEEVLGGRGRDE